MLLPKRNEASLVELNNQSTMAVVSRKKGIEIHRKLTLANANSEETLSADNIHHEPLYSPTSKRKKVSFLDLLTPDDGKSVLTSDDEVAVRL